MSAANRTKWAIILGSLWNWAGWGVCTIVGFILTPFLLHHLGENIYGVWMVIGALTGYFGLLELGIRRSVGRYVAYYRAQQQWEKISDTVSTAVAILAVVASLAFIGIAASQWFFFDLFDVPEEQFDNVRFAIVLVGINFALTLLLDIFDATLWGLQRFDLLNAIEIPAGIARMLLTFYFVGAQGGGLVTLGWITLSVNIAVGLTKAVLCFREEAHLRIRLKHVHWATCKEIFGYGMWNFLASLASLTRTCCTPLVIGVLMGVALTGAYSIVTRLTSTAAAVILTFTNGLIPWATAQHATENQDNQQKLFVLGGRFCCMLALYFFTLLSILGEALLLLWIGPNLLYALPLLIVLAAGEWLPNTQYATNSLLFAKAHHRVLAYCTLGETVAIVTLLIVLTPYLGLVGAALSLAIPATFCRGVALVVLGCRLVKVPLTRYVRDVVVLPVLAAVVPAAALACVTAWKTPDTWPLLIAYLAVYSPVFFILMLVLLEPERVRYYGSIVLNRIRAAKAKPATASAVAKASSSGGHLECHKLIS